MPNKKILPGFIKKILSGVEESDRCVTTKKRQELLDEEKCMLEETMAKDPLGSAAEMIRKKKKEKRHFFTGGNKVKHVFFRPVVMLSVQAECEKWWFSLSLAERMRLAEKYTGGGSLKEKFTRRTLSASENTLPDLSSTGMEKMSGYFISVLSDTLFRYWPVFFLFFAMTAVFAANIRLQSGAVALAGFVLCCVILWQCRLIKIKRELGLRFFCPFAVFFLQGVCLKEHKNYRKNCQNK
ncbi:MAG: hypothetical protein EOM00_15625 [Clostridia bacterium]|nr:hypothetical protein [Clostridia bacterium]